MVEHNSTQDLVQEFLSNKIIVSEEKEEGKGEPRPGSFQKLKKKIEQEEKMDGNISNANQVFMYIHVYTGWTGGCSLLLLTKWLTFYKWTKYPVTEKEDLFKNSAGGLKI
ncbi:hypothetical protein ACJX0J_010717, partial [Zea mays]